MNNLHVLSLLGLVLSLVSVGFSSKTFAQSKGISFQGVIKLPSGEYPTRPGITVNARILSVNDCILREEQFTGINISNGYVNLAIGTGTVGGYDPGFTMKEVMDNSKAITHGPTKPAGLVCLNSDGSVSNSVTSYNPDPSNNGRKFRLSLWVDSIPVVADFNMRSMAYAINSESLDGKTKDDFIQTSATLTQSRLEDFITKITSVSGGSVKWNGSSFVPFDPTDGTGLTAIPETAITSLPYSKLTSVPANLSQLAALVCGDGKIIKKTSGTWACADEATSGGASALSGDVSGTTAANTVDKIKGVPVSATPTANGQVFRYQGGSLVPSYITMQDLRSQVTGTQMLPANCSAKQTLTFNSATDSLTCVDIVITKSQITDLDSFWAAVTGGINYAGGNVGVGQAVPEGTLHVNGSGVFGGSIPPDVPAQSLYTGKIFVGMENGSTGIHMRRHENVASGPYLEFAKSMGTYNSPVPVVSGTRLGDVRFGGWMTAGTAESNIQKSSATMLSYSTENWSATGTGSELRFSTTKNGTTAAVNRLAIAHDGKIGMGTNLPQGNLHVASIDQATVPLAFGNEASIIIESNGVGPGSEGFIGSLWFGSRENTTEGSTKAAGIVGFMDEDVTTTSAPASLSFYTTPTGSTAALPRMIVDKTGNVGIGTSVPTAKLDVANSNPGGETLVLRDSKALVTEVAFSSYIRAKDSAGTNAWYLGDGSSTAKSVALLAYQPDYDIFFGTSVGTVMTLKNNGDVGIGKTSPTAKLDVDGTIKATMFEGPFTATTSSMGAGTNAAPSVTFSGDPDTGFYNTSSNNLISVATGGVKIFDFSSAGLVSPTTGGASISTSNGTAGSPTYGFTGDTDTGWYRPAENNMAASTGGAERIRIDNQGKVGIGTNSPNYMLDILDTSSNGSKFHISAAGDTGLYMSATNSGGATLSQGAASTGTAWVAKSPASSIISMGQTGVLSFLTTGGLTAGSAFTPLERMRIEPDGKVGIGTNTPTSQLEVSSTGATQLTVEGDGSNLINAALVLKAKNTSNARGLGVFMHDSGGQNEWFAGRPYMGGMGGSDAFVIQRLATTNHSNNAAAILDGSNQATGTTNFLTIKNDGKVGFGTVAPVAKFHISDGNTVNASLLNSSDHHLMSFEGVAAGSAITVAGSSATVRPVFKGVRVRGTLATPLVPEVNDQVLSVLGAIFDGATQQGTASIDFITDGAVSTGVAPQRIGFVTSATNGAARAERMTIKSNGNVGIGTTNPTHRLAVHSIDNSVNVEMNFYGRNSSSVGRQATIGINPDGEYIGMAWNSNISTPALAVYKNGYVGIGTTAPTQLLTVNGSAIATAWNTSSDRRLKENIKNIENPLDKIRQLRGVEFDWRKDVRQPTSHDQIHDIGVIAQEVEQVFPEAVTTSGDGFKSVAYSKLIGPVIEAVRQLYARTIAVESQQQSQDRKLAALTERLLALEERAAKVEKENERLKGDIRLLQGQDTTERR